MSSIKKRLQELKNKSNRLLDLESIKFNKKVKTYLTNAIGQITGVLNDFDKSGKFQVSDAEKLIREVERGILDAGLPEILRDFDNSFVTVGKDALSYFAAIKENSSIKGVDAKVFDILTRNRLDQFSGIIENDLVMPIRSKLIESVVGGKDIASVIGDITSFIRSENLLRKDGKQFSSENLEVLVNDSHRAFHAVVREEKAQEIGLDFRLYQGPDDSITRKACQAMIEATPHGVPGLYLAEEVTIDFMNDIIRERFPGIKDYELLEADPLIARGGYNCRHEFNPISAEMARELGFEE